MAGERLSQPTQDRGVAPTDDHGQDNLPNARRFADRVVQRIFGSLGLCRKEAPDCFDTAVRALTQYKVSEIETLVDSGGYHKLVRAGDLFNQLGQHSGAIPMESQFCPNAILMISAIAVIHYRRVPAGNVATSVARLFYLYKPIRWLRVAIQVYKQTKKNPFLIAIDNNLSKPTLNNPDGIWIVAAPSPAENGFSATVEEYFAPFSVEQRLTPPSPVRRQDTIDQSDAAVQTFDEESTPSDAIATKQVLVSRFLDRQEALTP